MSGSLMGGVYTFNQLKLIRHKDPLYRRLQSTVVYYLFSVLLSVSEEIAFWFAPSFLCHLLHLKSERLPQHIAQVVKSHLLRFI